MIVRHIKKGGGGGSAFSIAAVAKRAMRRESTEFAHAFITLGGEDIGAWRVRRVKDGDAKKVLSLRANR